MRASSPMIYRAGQVTADDLREARDELGVRTVINLRGDNPKSEWYQEEVQACRDLGLEYAEYRFESFEHPPQYETRMLVRDLISKPRPILLHCRSGHDRSGWAAAVARILDGEPVEKVVDEELSPLEGHVCDRDRCSLHGFFESYLGWLESEGLEHSPMRFRDWALYEYAPGKYDAEIEIVERPAGPHRPGEQIPFMVRVSNESEEDWSAGDDLSTGIRLGARIIGPWESRPDNELRMFRRFRSPSIDIVRARHGPIAAGQSEEIDVSLPVPHQPGSYTVQFDMVEEGVAWFSELGNPGVFEVIEVE